MFDLFENGRFAQVLLYSLLKYANTQEPLLNAYVYGAILNFGLSIHLNVHPFYVYVYASRSAQVRLCGLIYKI